MKVEVNKTTKRITATEGENRIQYNYENGSTIEIASQGRKVIKQNLRNLLNSQIQAKKRKVFNGHRQIL